MKTFHILNLGAGVQSTTTYLMDRDGTLAEELGLPRLDAAVFADTGEEPEAVYRHLAWLKSLGGVPILTGSAGRLGDDLSQLGESTGPWVASIPAFTATVEGKREGMARRQCTRAYKARVIDKVIRQQMLGLKPRQHVPQGVSVLQSLGLSFDEPKRVAKARLRFHSHPWSMPAFPLFDLFLTRGNCRTYLATQNIPHEVPRSACVFCPYRKNAEWRQLRDTDPAGWQRAIEIDANLRREGALINQGSKQALYVHPSCLPLATAPIDTPEPTTTQSRLDFSGYESGVSDQECEGMCGV